MPRPVVAFSERVDGALIAAGLALLAVAMNTAVKLAKIFGAVVALATRAVARSWLRRLGVDDDEIDEVLHEASE